MTEHAGPTGEPFVIHLDEQTVAAYQEIAQAARLDHAVTAAVAEAPVDTTDIDAVRGHLIAAHRMSEHEFYRDDTDADDPRMTPVDWETADRLAAMPAMTLHDLLVVHADDHLEDVPGADYVDGPGTHRHLPVRRST